MTDVEQRPRFYEGQYLEAADLMAAVDYSRAQLARTQIGAHTWGIALGLELREVPGPNGTMDVFIQPGYAWDGFGRPVVVLEPAKIPGALFSSYDAEFVPNNPPRTVEIWLRYDETMTKGPRPGFETCDDTDAFARVFETYRIEVGRRDQIEDRRDPIEIAGRVVDAAQALKTFDPTAPVLTDASVPHQSLPDPGAGKRWLIPLGVVAWKPGNPGSFVARSTGQLAQTAKDRRNCGVVAGAVESVGGHVRIHDRAKDYSEDVTDELLWVEGDLRMDGHARLYGKRLEFASSHTETPRAPYYVLRANDPVSTRSKLQLVIGDQNQGKNYFAVGQQTAMGVYAEHLVVTDKGNVGIGTSEPKAPLHLKEDGIQIGTNLTPEDNFHIKSDTDGPRALRIYNKDIGAGFHVATFTQRGRVGIGEGANAPTNSLQVNGNLGIRQNALYLSGNADWSSVSFNAHHSETNGTWIFPNPAKPAVTAEMDARSNVPRFEVFSTLNGDNQTWRSRLKVFGHSGDIGMAEEEGNVGIGTYSPAAKLDVHGEIFFGNNHLRPLGASRGLRVVAGNVNAIGSVAEGEGFTVTLVGDGRYRINFTQSFGSTPTVLVTKVYGDFGIDAGTAVRPQENAIVDFISTTYTLIAVANETGTLVNSNFCFMVIGTR